MEQYVLQGNNAQARQLFSLCRAHAFELGHWRVGKEIGCAGTWHHQTDAAPCNAQLVMACTSAAMALGREKRLRHTRDTRR